MMTEMDKKIRMVEEVVPQQDRSSSVSSLQKKSVLVDIMDPMTQQDTRRRTTGGSFKELLKVVLEFGNNDVANSGTRN